MIQNKERKTTLYWALFSVVVVIATYFRLVGLGTWGFSSSDEYYIAKTGQNILKYGLPKFETGGYYTRGVLYEYFSVFLLSLGIKDILAYRLVSVIFNVLSVPALFLLIKKISNSKIALLSVFLFLFSVLEIEFARLARFYTTFQAFFLWYLFFLYNYIVENNASSKKWMYLISVLSVFVYEGSIFIVLLNFLPFVYENKKIILKEYITPIVILILTFLFLKTDFRNMGVSDFLPADISLNDIKSYSSVINLPKILLSTITKNIFWLFPFLIVIGFSSYSLFGFIKENKKNVVLILGLILLMVLALLNQFGLVIYISLLLILTSNFNWKEIFSSKGKLFFYAITLNLIFWFLYSFFTPDWIGFYPEVNSFSIKRVLWLFFNYPNIYEAFVLPWLYPIPIQTILTFVVLGSFLIFITFSANGKKVYRGYKFLFTVFILMIIGLSIVVTPYNYARYSFFIYPLMLAFIPITFNHFSNFFFDKKKVKLAAQIIALIIFLFVSEDFSFNHIINIDSKEINFKEGFNRKQSGFYYFREDYETVGTKINKYRGKDDIVLSTLAPAEYYIDNLDYYYRNFRDNEFSGRSRESGKKEIWTNSKLIYTEKSLMNFLENRQKTIWLVTYSNERYYVSELNIMLNERFKDYLFYSNLNKTINVYKISDRFSERVK